ncbi:hypothetical protein M514_17368 [Trichuris suis]|uniref:Uncharacterized protein n=1 Tax=Trichuris suis TaxID=68888 RepID=A0A085N5G0_9BILA|nr:hypothetical protein M513_13539 [Trichuris suis]KFD62200.1 hypothetical protein M514_13539 [Trichuris suis]KFD63760.1 hypothetical protein M514_24113 [Trichuris suis]KFD64706.1 hypothetical protein M514_23164 [Trichuris suis]KFD70575.1 hypothetical protein M514_17368 [Trichuris suis]
MNSHEDNSSVLLTPDSILAFGLSPHGLHCLDLLRRRLTDEVSRFPALTGTLGERGCSSSAGGGVPAHEGTA